MRFILLPLLTISLAVAQEDHGDDKRGYTDTPTIPGQKWRVHDAARPRPVKIRAQA